MTTEEIYKKILSLAPYKRNKEKKFLGVLGNAFNEYINDIKEIDVQNRDAIMRDVNIIMRRIYELVEKSYEGQHTEAYESLMRLWKEQYDIDGGLYKESFNVNEKKFYRMRIFENRRVDISRDEMFHVPLNMRRKIKTQRYSIPGYPCLYMGLSVYACWEEMGRPRMSDCWISKLENKKEINLLDLRVPNEVTFKNDIRRYIKIFPLIIACMIPVDEIGDVYKPEYIVPQLMMEWVLNHEKVDGILYTSTIKKEDFRYANEKSENVAIPVKKPLDPYLYCLDLAGKFNITDPINVEIEQWKDGGVERERDVKGSLDEQNYKSSTFGYIESKLDMSILWQIRNKYIKTSFNKLQAKWYQNY